MAVGMMLATAGCFRLARPTPPLEVYLLGGSSKVSPAPAGSASFAPPVAAVPDSCGLTIGLRRLDLAEYAASQSIIVRRESRVLTSAYHRWSEEPAAGIARTLGAALRQAPTIRAADIAPWAVGTPHDYLVQVHVSRFEGVAPADSSSRSGEVHLMASWEIIRPSDGALAARGVTVRRESGWNVGDYAGLVSRLDQGLAALAGEVVACLGKLKPVVAAERVMPMECGAR